MRRAALALGLGALLLAASLASAEVVQKGQLRVSVQSRLSPSVLPRRGVAPVAVSITGKIASTGGGPLPQLKTLQIEFNRNGRLEDSGLPVCPRAQIKVASSAAALALCRSALVGDGSFHANIVLAGQAPSPIAGRLLIFNGREHGQPVLLGHIYAEDPFATSFLIVFRVSHRAHGAFGTVLRASLPEALGTWGYVTAIEIRLFRTYSYRGRRRSYLSAGCPAPDGLSVAPFPLARSSFSFAGGRRLQVTLTRSCRVR